MNETITTKQQKLARIDIYQNDWKKMEDHHMVQWLER